MQIGYARVSTQDQDLRLQYDALQQAHYDKIYEDKASGVKASWEGLKLVRLGRSVKDLVMVICNPAQRRVETNGLLQPKKNLILSVYSA